MATITAVVGTAPAKSDASIAPVQIDLAYAMAAIFDTSPGLVAAVRDGIMFDKKARTSWAVVLDNLAKAFGDKLSGFPVPNSEQATQLSANEWLPADKWSRTVIGADGAKEEKGSFYKSLFLATNEGKAIIKSQNSLTDTVSDARERKSEDAELGGDITSGVKLLRRAMNVQHQVWRINEMAPHVTVRLMKKKDGSISASARNIEIVQTEGDKEIIGKGDVLGYSAFVRLDVAKAFEKRAKIKELVTVLDLLETNTRGADDEENGEEVATNNYPAPKNMNDFENLVATFATFAEKLATADGQKALFGRVNAAGSDDFIRSIEKVYSAVMPVATNPVVKRRLADLDNGDTSQRTTIAAPAA